jgi:WD40 repeat protein
MVQLDENRLATCSYDKSVKIYNFRTANLVAALQEHTDEVYQLAVSKKHRLLASSSYDQTVRVWKEYSTWKLLITLRGHT